MFHFVENKFIVPDIQDSTTQYSNIGGPALYPYSSLYFQFEVNLSSNVENKKQITNWTTIMRFAVFFVFLIFMSNCETQQTAYSWVVHRHTVDTFNTQFI